MPDGPPTPPSPKAVAKGAKNLLAGKPKWMWALGLSVVVGVAYLAWKRSQTGTTDDTDATVSDSLMGTGDTGSGFAYGSTGGGYAAGPTEGAVDYGSPVPIAEPMPVDFPIYYQEPAGPAPAFSGDVPIAAALVTGGGAPATPPAKKPVAPQLGPNIFYNQDRKLRYIVQKHDNGGSYRHYESSLNKGDWGHGAGGPILIDGTLPKPKPPTPAAPPTGGGPPRPSGGGGPQPILGPNIFWNASRGLRYIIQKPKGKGNYRYYESALNRGDWGKGGVIPQ